MRSLEFIRDCARRLVARQRPDVADESGFILVISVILLLVITLAIGAISIAALDVNNQSTRQGKSQRADAAANSGAEVALYTLNNNPTSAGASSGSGTMADGESYSYTVTALTSSGSACAGLWVQTSASGQTLTQDCISSTGTVGTVSERVEERVVGYAASATTSLFPVNGAFAINGLTADTISGAFSLGSNSTLGLQNANLTLINGKIEYLAGKLTQSQNSGQMCEGSCTPDVLTSALTVPTVADSVYLTAATTNNDLTGITYTNASYSSSTHVISVTNNSASVTFAPGTYYLCGINGGGFSNFAIKLSGSGLVQIYMDSQYRSGSSCTQSGNGQISNTGNAVTINNGGVSSNLQLFFYGEPTCTTSCPLIISPDNATDIYGDVFAPYSQTGQLGNSFTMYGALVIAEITANSFAFTYQAPASGGGGSGGGTASTYYPAANEDCIASTSNC